MVVFSRNPEGESGNCPTCHAEIVIERSSTVGDATCPNCGRLIWFIQLGDAVHTFNSVDDRVSLRLADYLARRGFRMTNQRRLIARLVTIVESPFSADDLLKLAQYIPNDQRITTPTVYRTLGEFVDAQILAYAPDADDTLYLLC